MRRVARLDRQRYIEGVMRDENYAMFRISKTPSGALLGLIGIQESGIHDILSRKFGIDKRKAHLSNLILSGQMTRDQALAELQQPTYDPGIQEEDRAYVSKKLGLSTDEFEALLNLPNRRHEEFGTDAQDLKRLRGFMGWIRPFTTLAKKGGWRLDT